MRSDSAQEGAILVGPAPLADCGRCEETRVALSPQCWPAASFRATLSSPLVSWQEHGECAGGGGP